MNIGERPGVYTSYDVSGTMYSGVAGGVAGLAATAAPEKTGRIYTITSYAAAVSEFGADSPVSNMVKILIKNGVSIIKAACAADTAGYGAAFKLLMTEEDVKVITCDSALASVHAALKAELLGADQRNSHKIAVVEGSGTVAELIAAAQAINCERIVLAAPEALDTSGGAAPKGTLAAAVAGAILSERDPAIPLNGAALFGLGGVSESYNDGDITLLVRGGVTPVEAVGGEVRVIRGITTRSTTDGTSDPTWRELTTTLIIDDVIPTVRDALKNSFTRTKNTAQTRDAIRTRVIVELEKKVSAEIIDSYGNVAVAQDGSDPTICQVSFDFTVVHGINQIRLTAYITV